MKDTFKSNRKTLRKKWSNETRHGSDKVLNRRIVRKRMKNDLHTGE